MKKRNILAIILAIAAISCSKKADEISKPIEKSFTQWHHYFNDAGEFQRTELVIHWHRVGGADLARLEQLPAKQNFCDDNDVLETVLAPACAGECVLK